MKKANIVLIGLSGCGKTTIGRHLSDILNYSFIDTDARIEAVNGMPVTAIFDKYGEEHFRRLEAETIKYAAHSEDTVIATGGGCVLNPDNMKALSENGRIVYLKCSPEKVYLNIKDDTSRPLLQSADKLQRITQMLELRAPLYEKYADIIINITDRDVDTAVELVSKICKGGP